MPTKSHPNRLAQWRAEVDSLCAAYVDGVRPTRVAVVGAIAAVVRSYPHKALAAHGAGVYAVHGPALAHRTEIVTPACAVPPPPPYVHDRLVADLRSRTFSHMCGVPIAIGEDDDTSEIVR